MMYFMHQLLNKHFHHPSIYVEEILTNASDDDIDEFSILVKLLENKLFIEYSN